MSVNTSAPRGRSFFLSPVFILFVAALIVFMSLGIRQSFGLFMRPITMDLGWGREVLSVALATQNLMIGIAAPIAGILADRWGAPRTIALGGLIFSLGMVIMSQSTAPTAMFASAGLMAGIGLSACGLPLVLSVVGKIAPAEKRSLWLGIVTACATGGQLLIVPLSQTLLSTMDWVVALVALALIAGLIIPMAYSMSAAVTLDTGRDTEIDPKEAIGEAVGHRGYILLTAGFFVCGFQVAFIAIHLPAYLADEGISPALGATALMLIALFNMGGSWTSGWLAGRIPNKYLLASIYILRSMVIAAFITLPISPLTVVFFACAVGFLWLSTVPATSGLVAQIFGTRYMAMLYGVVYMSHQFGSFTGVWLGGSIFDATGSYDPIWWGAVALGVVSAILHLPINDQPVARLSRQN